VCRSERGRNVCVCTHIELCLSDRRRGVCVCTYVGMLVSERGEMCASA
jgi:hypothetical protein